MLQYKREENKLNSIFFYHCAYEQIQDNKKTETNLYKFVFITLSIVQPTYKIQKS